MEAFEFVVDSLLSISPAQYLQAFYVLGTASILFIHALPADLRSALVEYGARQQTAENKSVIALVVKFAQVPHSWFLHFYILSVGLSLFWGWQYVTKGDILSSIVWAQVNGPGGDGPSMDISQVFVAWGLLTAQGARRLFEIIFIMAPGKSHMSILHWVFGITFYTAMSMSMWIEGSGAILKSWEEDTLEWSLPPVVPFAVGIFTMGWHKQYDCHSHLAGLEKYTLPSEGWFQRIICPHYTSECLMYLALSIVAAPPGQFLNRTVLLGLALVVVNLGATASGTKVWYEKKFGREQVAPRWRMIPYIW